MMNLLKKLTLGQRITLTICTFTLPVIVLGVICYRQIDKDIQFGEMEKRGNQYQRPLEQLLALIPQHQLLAHRYLSGEKQLAGELSLKQTEIDKAFESLQAVHARLGVILQFTEQGLAARKRD